SGSKNSAAYHVTFAVIGPTGIMIRSRPRQYSSMSSSALLPVADAPVTTLSRPGTKGTSRRLPVALYTAKESSCIGSDSQSEEREYGRGLTSPGYPSSCKCGLSQNLSEIIGIRRLNWHGLAQSAVSLSRQQTVFQPETKAFSDWLNEGLRSQG